MSGILSVVTVYRSVGLARCWGNLAAHSVVCIIFLATSRVWCVGWCSWPAAKYIRSRPTLRVGARGPEFTAKKVREWLTKVGVKTLFIEPGSPWENGYCESFNGRLRDELLAREQFDTLLEAKVLIERWRRHYNTVRPHGSLGYRPPAPEATQPLHFVPATPPRSEVAGLAVRQRVT
jgi:transposase InsO family protein